MVWNDPAVAAVVIATTTNTHRELALAAAAHGKHILLEKPMALTVEECFEVEDAAKRADVRLMMGYKFRFTAAVVAAHEAVPAPSVVLAHTMYDPTSGDGWVNDRTLSGGRLVSSLVHAVDLLRFFTGSEVKRVFAEGANVVFPELGERDTAVATLLFRNGAIGSIVHGTVGESALLSAWSFQAAAAGINATVNDHGRRLKLHRAEGEADPADVVDPSSDPYTAGTGPLLDAFVAAVKGTGPASPDGRDGILSMMVSRSIEEAMATGEPQTLPESV
jgi:myo-inositol 2-dehydrogenase/D-chiro-inositol 1-dehydrogenase/scyllo-inositol 2-dehydrogenase (NAD+)